MSFLSTTHTTVVTTTLPSSVTLSQVLSLLHDHSAMISMNPLVISHRRLRPSLSRSRASSSSSHSSNSNSFSQDLDSKPLPPPPTYEVVDSLDNSILVPDDDNSNSRNSSGGSWTARLTSKLSPSTVTYTAQMRNVPHGLETVINAPMGIRNRSTWSVWQEEGKGLVLEERSEMSANRLVIGFVSKTAKDSHEKLVQRFVERLGEGGWDGEGEWDEGSGWGGR